MNTRTFAAGLLALGIACSGSAAAAQKAPETLTNKDVAQLFTIFDTNGDMKLSGKELDPIRPKLSLFDGNGDGEVAVLEFTMTVAKAQAARQAGAAPAAPPPKAAPTPAPADEFTALDANRDGVLTGAEFGTHRENARFDENRDGRVSRAEWTAGQARERAGILR